MILYSDNAILYFMFQARDTLVPLETNGKSEADAV